MIREDWINVKLGDAFFTTSGGTPSRTIAKYFDGDIPWVKSGELNYNIIKDTEEHISEEAIKNSSAKVFPEETLLIALYGATIGKLAILGVPAATNQAICGIYKNNNFLTKFVFYFLLYKKTSLIGQGVGGAQSNISQTILKRLLVPVVSKPEQRAIVAKIEELFSELDSGIESLKKAKEQLEIYRQAVSKAAFEGKLTKEWRKENKNLSTTDDLIKEIEKERSDYYNNLIMKWKDDVKEWEDGKTEKKPSRPRKIKEINPIEDDKLLNVIPKSWEWTRLSNIVLDSSNDIVDGPFGSNLKSTEYIDSGYPVLRIQNIKANRFINKNFKYISFDKYNSLSRHHFRTGDLIVTKLGNPLGLTCRVPSYMKEGVIVADLIRISPTLKHINYNWLTYLLNSEVIQAQFRKITKGTTRPRMNLTIMRDTIIPICSIEEQTQIVAAIESRISVCENIEANIEEALEKAEALRQSILKKAFEGKLLSKEELEACKQEDDWEPAEKLLKRIKEVTKEAK